MDPISELLTSRTITRDLVGEMLGRKLGEGVSRQVFENRLDPTTVIKIEPEGGMFQNVVEYLIWTEVKNYKKMSKWFAPVVSISANGAVLIQKKVGPTSQTHYPKQIPQFLMDVKYDNFGMLDGNLVAFDYGTSLFTRGYNTKLKKADWH